MKKILYTIAFCLFTSTVAFAQTNLLLNPGFETADDTGVNPASWNIETEGGIATVTLSSESIQEGSRSLKIVADDNNGLVRISQYVEVTSGKKYDLSIWCNVISPLDGYFYTGYEFLNNNGEAISNKLNDYYPNSSNIWSQIQYKEIEAPANAAYLRFKVETSYSANLYIDNASVTEAGSTGINETTADQKSVLPVRKDGDNLIVTTNAGSSIEVYSILGAKLQNKVAESNETVIGGLPKGQLLIIRSGNAVAKVVL